jgi:hypothetical protein
MGIYSKIWRFWAKKSTPVEPLNGPPFLRPLQISLPSLHSWRPSRPLLSPPKMWSHHFYCFSFFLFTFSSLPPVSLPQDLTGTGTRRRQHAVRCRLRGPRGGRRAVPRRHGRRRRAPGPRQARGRVRRLRCSARHGRVSQPGLNPTPSHLQTPGAARSLRLSTGPATPSVVLYPAAATSSASRAPPDATTSSSAMRFPTTGPARSRAIRTGACEGPTANDETRAGARDPGR